MKAIISHDIDHLTVWEHTKDLIVPKFIIRANIELATGKISFSEYLKRLSDLLGNKWQQIDELIAFNESNGVPSSFFIGVNNGLGLSYSVAQAAVWIEKISKRNIEIGVHGIDFESFETVKREYDIFNQYAAGNSFGMRMHYVRKNENTLKFMEQSGYTYDSTENSFRNPYKIGNMWEFPFQIMDGWVIDKGKRWQNQTLQQAKDTTLKLIDEAHQNNLEYLGVIFHDRYFSDSFKTWKNWYIWMVEYLSANKIQFVNFGQAISQLEHVNNETSHTHAILSA
ncbi:MAG: hypothetical protein M3R27_06660 [Bacteroidota bacterium]|nr:hypothetical protein [Bacteroidota bacterium]